MKYIEFSKGNIVFISVQDSPDMYDVLVEEEHSNGQHRIFILKNGSYDGDVKDLILAKNDFGDNILIRLPLVETQHGLLFTTVGQSISLAWSNRYGVWFIRGVGCELTKMPL